MPIVFTIILFPGFFFNFGFPPFWAAWAGFWPSLPVLGVWFRLTLLFSVFLAKTPLLWAGEAYALQQYTAVRFFLLEGWDISKLLPVGLRGPHPAPFLSVKKEMGERKSPRANPWNPKGLCL